MRTERQSCLRSLFGALSRRVGALQMSIIIIIVVVVVVVVKSKILSGTEIFARDDGKRENYTYC